MHVVTKKITNIIKYSLSALLMVVLLFFAFRSVDWKNFADGVRSTDFVFVLLSMLCGLTAFFLRSLRWRMLLRPLDPEIGFMRSFDGVNIGNLANCCLPFAGEFVRCGVVCTPKASYDKTLGTIALERLWDFISIIIIVVLALCVKGGVASDFLSQNLWGPMAQNFGRLWWIAVLALLVAAGLVLAVVKLRDRSRILGKIYSVVAGLAQGFVSFSKMGRKWLFLLLTLLIWLCYWLMCVSISHGFPAAGCLTVSDTLFVMAVGNLASVIPVPGGFGAYHYIIALALSSIYGLSWDNGIVFATLSHESQAIVMITFGLICYVHRTLTMRKK